MRQYTHTTQKYRNLFSCTKVFPMQSILGKKDLTYELRMYVNTQPNFDRVNCDVVKFLI